VVLVAAVGYWAAQDVLNTIAGYYSAVLNLRAVTLWRAGGQLATLIGLLAIVGLHVVSVGSALLVVAIGYFVGAAALALGLRSAGRPQRPEMEQIRFVLGFTRNVWLIGAVSLAYTPQVYVLLIGLITKKAAEVAFYVAAVGVLGRVQALLIAGWSSIIIPTFGALHRRDGLAGLARGFRLFTKFWLLISAPMSALLFVLAGPLINVLFGHSYARSVLLLQLVAAFGFVTTFLSPPPSLSALWALDLQRVVVRVRMVSTSIGILVTVFLIYRHGATGAVVGAGATTAVTSAVEFFLAHRAVHFSYPTVFAGWTALASALFVLPAVLIGPHGAVGMMLAIALGICVITVAAVVIRPFRQDDLDAMRSISPRLGGSLVRMLVR
jgi:O-antigen/teichoic acid export membrane protein